MRPAPRWASFAAVHALHQAVQLGARPDAFTPVLAGVHAATVALALWRPRVAMALVAALGLLECVHAFPRTATHQYLGVVVSLLLVLLLDDDAELKRAALALPLIVFAWSGVQKLVHGYWLDGQLLAWMMTGRNDVAVVARPLLDDAVAQTLGALPRDVEGSGPFRLSGAWVLASNGVWLIELVSPLSLLARRHAWWLLLALTWGIQLVAHEWQFALLFSNLLLCAGPPRVQVPARAVLIAALLVLALARLLGLGLMPEVGA